MTRAGKVLNDFLEVKAWSPWNETVDKAIAPLSGCPES